MSQSGRIANVIPPPLKPYHPADHREDLKQNFRDFWEPNIWPLSLSKGGTGVTPALFDTLKSQIATKAGVPSRT